MSIHGHDVLHYIIDQRPKPEQLEKHIADQYGSDATFHTCSAEDLKFPELISLLESMDKIGIEDGV